MTSGGNNCNYFPEKNLCIFLTGGAYAPYAPCMSTPLEDTVDYTVGLSTTAIFSVFAGCFFGNFRDEASIIILRYAVRRQFFSDIPIW